MNPCLPSLYQCLALTDTGSQLRVGRSITCLSTIAKGLSTWTGVRKPVKWGKVNQSSHLGSTATESSPDTVEWETTFISITLDIHTLYSEGLVRCRIPISSYR